MVKYTFIKIYFTFFYSKKHQKLVEVFKIKQFFGGHFNSKYALSPDGAEFCGNSDGLMLCCSRQNETKQA